MKKIICVVTIAVILITACVSKNQPIVKNDRDTYVNEWAEIDSLRKQSLPKSLLPKVDTIYQSALAEQNYEQLIKAIIFRLNCIGILEENDEGANRIFNTLKKDAETMPQPAKSIVYSMIGQMYEEFYNQNARLISRRINTAIEKEDVNTWDARSLAEEAIKYYHLSLQERKALQNENIESYKEILQEGFDAEYQPTLYDLLAKRALAYFSSDFNVHVLSKNVFILNNPNYFADAKKFAKLDIITTDTLSPEFLTLKVYQELLRFHAEKNNIAALIDVDLRRISFLKENGRYADNEQMYKTALIDMSEYYKSYAHNARVLLQLGIEYCAEGQSWRYHKQDKYKSGYAKAYEICERIENKYPDQLKDNVETMKAIISNREVELRIEESLLPDKAALALLKFRNIDTLYQITYKLSEKEALDFHKINHYSSRDNTLFTFVKELNTDPERKPFRLPEHSDFQYYSTEIKIDPMEKGFYLLLLSDQEDPLNSSRIFAHALIQVSSLMAYDRTVDGITSVMVTDRESGVPFSGGKVTFYIENKAIGSFKSNNNGMANGKVNDGNRYNYYTAEYKDEKLFVFNSSYNRRTYNNQASNRSIMFTDRSIYRPGQTVYFKAIIFNNVDHINKKLLNERTVNIRFRDVNRQVISEKTLVTNDFGSIDGSFTIPQGQLNGNMTIECSESGSISITVEEYKRPTFEVKFDPIKGNFALNEQVTVTANAKALAGFAIDNADVQYSVRRGIRSRRYWWFIEAESREIGAGVMKTDANGNFSIVFDAFAEDVKDDSQIYMYTVTADITDITGETRSASIDVNISKKPLLLSTNLPEIVTSGKLNDYTVETTNLNGDFTPASVMVEIISLKQPVGILRKRIWNYKEIDIHSIPENEFRKDFPLDAYGAELDPMNCEELKTIAKYEIETEKNKKLDLSSLKQQGYYKIKLTADNKKGVVIEHVRCFYISGDKTEKIGNMDNWIISEKTTGEPGEQVEFLIAGGMENSHVYCELIHNNKIIEAKWIKTGTTPVSVTYPIREEYRGGFSLQFSMIQHNRKYVSIANISVPYTNKMLDVKLATFRDMLLPGEHEKWTMKITNKEKKNEAAEVVASLYDASLDMFKPHSWQGISAVYAQNANASSYVWNYRTIEWLASSRIYYDVSLSRIDHTVALTDINWFEKTYKIAFYANTPTYAMGDMLLRSRATDIDEAIMPDAANVIDYEMKLEESMVFATVQADHQSFESQTENGDLIAIETRTNFNETAFFYPMLHTNEMGEVLIEFTMPEALTRWKLLSFSHTQDFKVGSYTNELITQKQVAISANAPRFFRENDVIEFTAKVNNLTETDLSGQALLRLYDAVTMEPVDAIIKSEKTQSFNVPTGGSERLSWKLEIPVGLQAVTYKITAQAGTHTDGEEKTVPVLTNSMLVTETLPFSIRAGKEKTFTFDRLVNNKSKTLRNHSLTLEYTSAPAWYAVQALPYIMEYPYECAEQTFSRYYANTLATTVVNKTPRIKQIFDLWNALNSDALMSDLEKNQELKQVMLEETPWVVQAKNETERKKRIGLLLDLNRMSNEMNRAFNKLKNIQNSDGGFPWFEGNPSSRYITQHIVAGMAHLEKLGAMQEKNVADAAVIVQRGMPYLDSQIRNDYNYLLNNKSDLEKRHISSIQLHYLYACSFNGHKPDGKQKEAFDYYLSQTGRFWLEFTIYDKAMAALVLHRNNQTETAMMIIRSLKEYAQQAEEMGMYWKDNVAGYFWYQAPIETQAMLIEAFNEVANDEEAVEEMKIWLLRNKQTNDWKTTKATSEAIYALLMTGGNLLDESQLLEIEIAGKPLMQVVKEEIKPEPGTGYVKTSWQGGDIMSQMGNLKVKNPNAIGIAWGGMYWQYFEQLDKITSAETNLRMNKQLFLRVFTNKGEQLQPINENSSLKVGDLVRVRMELRADRDYEYVHLKDMRASGFEPVSTVSGHRYQDGLWYYESIKDASTNFFITFLRKGTYVFEYDLRVSHAGDFSNGITTFQCMYAPEFSAHSEGGRVEVRNEK